MTTYTWELYTKGQEVRMFGGGYASLDTAIYKMGRAAELLRPDVTIYGQAGERISGGMTVMHTTSWEASLADAE